MPNPCRLRKPPRTLLSVTRVWVNGKLILVSLVNFVSALVNLGDLYPVSVAASAGRLASYLCAAAWQIFYARRGFVARDDGVGHSVDG